MAFKMKQLASLACIAMMTLPACSIIGGDKAEKLAARSANPGPCPRAFALYDASRVVEIKGAERFSNVGYTAEINNVRALCRYYSDKPIDAELEIDMSFGRGPAAIGQSHTYQYWVAVTRNNAAVIEKEFFPITVNFPEGVDQMETTEKVGQIIIPRVSETTSGANFEIVVGYALTPQQLSFNAEGKRFRVSAGQ